MNIKITDSNVIAILSTLESNGFKAWVVGGCTRDSLLSQPIHDWDIVTNAHPEQILRVFPRTLSIGQSFGVIVVIIGDTQYEIATLRRDGVYSDSRRPDDVEYTESIDEDAKRRDFTVNAIYADRHGVVYTPIASSLQDLEDKTIQFIGSPTARIEEDPLRMLRAIRFTSRKDWTLESRSRDAIIAFSYRINTVSPERIVQEFDKIFACADTNAYYVLLLFIHTELLKHILPEVEALIDVEQNPEWHNEGNAFVHTVQVLRAAHTRAIETGETPEATATLCWAAMLHDIGKLPCFSRDENGQPKSHRHAIVGSEMVEAILRRLKFSNDRREAIVYAVENHMRLKYVGAKSMARRRRFYGHPNFELLYKLGYADSAGSECAVEHEATKYKWQDKVIEVAEMFGSLELPPRRVTGDDLIAHGVEPGKRMGTLLESAYDIQLNDIDNQLTKNEIIALVCL